MGAVSGRWWSTSPLSFTWLAPLVLMRWSPLRRWSPLVLRLIWSGQNIAAHPQRWIIIWITIGTLGQLVIMILQSNVNRGLAFYYGRRNGWWGWLLSLCWRVYRGGRRRRVRSGREVQFNSIIPVSSSWCCYGSQSLVAVVWAVAFFFGSLSYTEHNSSNVEPVSPYPPHEYSVPGITHSPRCSRSDCLQPQLSGKDENKSFHKFVDRHTMANRTLWTTYRNGGRRLLHVVSFLFVSLYVYLVVKLSKITISHFVLCTVPVQEIALDLSWCKQRSRQFFFALF